MSNADLNARWAFLLVDALVARGVRSFYIASGSRSSPLTVAAARHPGAATQLHFDERGLAFQALGHSRANEMPCAIITTSGTAVANLWPAVVESSQSCVPLVLLTADRPPELRGTGANQTIDQVHLFGTYARWFKDVPCPENPVEPAAADDLTNEALRQALGAPAGPVHLNLMFREPLAPEPVGGRSLPELRRKTADLTIPGSGELISAPPVADLGLDQETMDRLFSSNKGLVVVGSLPSPRATKIVGSFLDQLGWPVFADITSGLRLGSGPETGIPYHDALLQHPGDWKSPEAVLHLGGPFVSKRLSAYLAAARPSCVVQAAGPFGKYDPDGILTDLLPCTAEVFCTAAARSVSDRGNGPWTESWRAANRTVAVTLDEFFTQTDELSEPMVSRLISKQIPPEHALILGNSMPVRDMNTFGLPNRSAVRVMANRGASGIDGTVATGIGFGRGAECPVTIVLGDLALLHDLNSLSLASRSAHPVIIIVLNNNGGGIFHFLPIAKQEDVFETFFGTPHDLHFDHAARQFGLAYARPDSFAAFVSAYGEVLTAKQPALIEVVTDRVENAALHEKLLERVRAGDAS